jgi:predicted ATPase with chaperone activity
MPLNLKLSHEWSTIVLMENLENNPREITRDPLQPEVDRQGVSSLILPQSLDDLGLPPIFLAQLVLKHCFFLDVFLLGDLVERLKISASIISRVLDYLKKEKYVDVRGPDPLSPTVSSVSLAQRHSLTESGKKRAAQLLEYDAYCGPVPVRLEEYWRRVEAQSLKLAQVTPAQLQRAFEGLILGPEITDRLGVAAVSGKPLFLYGPSGNGKTAISLCLGNIWDDSILVPFALFVAGQVIQVFDETVHFPLKEAVAGAEREDRRWVRCRRPTVIVGGELTLDMLDLAYKPALKYYEAPLQLKANNGVFIVDDFGRQRLSPQELLNRWIIPLENHQDFLHLRTGQKIAIPFDLFIVFATNLEPRTLVDDAFLRRLRSKVKVESVSRDQFSEIFRLCCEQYGFTFDPNMVEYLLATYYDNGQQILTACHPRDLLEQIQDYSRFHQTPPRLTPENLDRACQSYFVS